MRTEYPRCWLRLHTLPEAKRPAGGPRELEEVLRRFEAVVDDVIGPGEPVEIVLPASGPTHELRTLLPDVASLEGDEPPLLWHASSLWRPGLLATTLGEIAVGELQRVLLFGPRRDEVVSLYEGGMDVFGPDPTLHRVRERFRAWLSDRPDGL